MGTPLFTPRTYTIIKVYMWERERDKEDVRLYMGERKERKRETIFFSELERKKEKKKKKYGS